MFTFRARVWSARSFAKPGQRAVVIATLMLAALPLAWGEALPARLTVSLLQPDGATVQIRLRVPADPKPMLDGAGPAAPGFHRLVLAWAFPVKLDRPLPVLLPEEMSSLQALTLHEVSGQARLELHLAQAVHPDLRRVGDSWVLRLEPAAPAALPPAPAAAPMPAATAIPIPSPGKGVAPAPAPLDSSPRRPLRAVQVSRNGPTASQPEVLLLDVTVNGQRLADVVRAEQWPDAGLLMPAEAWAEARLIPPAQVHALSDGTPAYALDSLPGATYRLNRQSLHLEISAPASAFVGSTLGPQGALAVMPPRSESGALLNYDLSLAYSGGAAVSSGAILEAIAFNRFGNFASSVLVRNQGATRTAQRLDTFWRYDMPERLEALVVGDTVGAGGGWSRPARYGGVRWSRDFGMRPGFLTFPQPTLAAEAALPSTVEVLVNNARRVSQAIPPGPFELSNVPVVTGAGEINLVVRDLLGRETTVRQSYYASPRLLAPGLTDFSLEAGRLRLGYGRDSHYGDAFASGALRGGLTPGLTGEVRLELQALRRAAGIELSSLLGTWGLGRMALATSSGSTHGIAERGQLVQLGIERSTPHGGGALQYESASRGFAPFGEANGAIAATQRARERWLATLGGPLWGAVSGGVSYVRQTRWDGDRVQVAGLSLNLPLWQRASMSISLNRRLDGDQAWYSGINISLPLDGGIYTAARLDRGSGGQLGSVVSAGRNAPVGPGLGWHAEASTQESQRARGGLQFNTSQSELVLDLASDAKGQLASRAGARGTVGLLGGLPFASRAVGQGSFAVVEVEGLAGVAIKRSHQVVAETNDHGLAFVPGLLPWQKNQIEIDPVELPLDTEVGNVVQEIVPYAGSGSVVKFAVRRTRQALVVLHQRSGQPVPVGTRVQLLPAGAEFMAGRRGEVWLTDLAADRQRLQVNWPGGSCQLEFAVPAIGSNPGKIGPLTCKRE